MLKRNRRNKFYINFVQKVKDAGVLKCRVKDTQNLNNKNDKT